MFGIISFREEGNNATFSDQTYDFQHDQSIDSHIACDSCRTHRVKCDGNKSGCARCISHHYECKYAPTIRRRPYRATKQGGADLHTGPRGLSADSIGTTVAARSHEGSSPLEERAALELPDSVPTPNLNPAPGINSSDGDKWAQADSWTLSPLLMSTDAESTPNMFEAERLSLDNDSFEASWPQGQSTDRLPNSNTASAFLSQLDELSDFSELFEGTPNSTSSHEYPNVNGSSGSVKSPVNSLPCATNVTPSAVPSPARRMTDQRSKITVHRSQFYNNSIQSSPCSCLHLLTSSLDVLEGLRRENEDNCTPSNRVAVDDWKLMLQKTTIDQCNTILLCKENCKSRQEYVRLLFIIIERLTDVCAMFVSECVMTGGGQSSTKYDDMFTNNAGSVREKSRIFERQPDVILGKYIIDDRHEARSVLKTLAFWRYRALVTLYSKVEQCIPIMSMSNNPARLAMIERKLERVASQLRPEGRNEHFAVGK